MKNIRFVTAILTILIIFSLSLSSCEESQVETTSKPQPITPYTQGDINKEIKDSLNNFNTKIEAISKESKATANEVTLIKVNVSKLQDNEIWQWVAVGFGVIAIILCMFCFKSSSTLKKRANRQRNDIQNLQRAQQEKSFAPQAAAKASIPTDYENIKRRISILELQMNQLKSEKKHMSMSDVDTSNAYITSCKNGYFGNPIQSSKPYFKKIIISRDSEARFSVEISDNKAIFKPVEAPLGTFISNDAMRAAIDFAGCPQSEASSMQVIKPGKAEQRDSRWYVTEKVLVNLSR